MALGRIINGFPDASGSLDADDKLLVLEDGVVKLATKAQVIPDVDWATQAELDAAVISGGGSAEASEAQALAGTDSGTRMSPRRVKTIIDIVTHDAPKPATKAAARLATPATAQQLRWSSIGDSMAMLKMRYMYPLLQRAWGGHVAGAGPGRDVSGAGYRVVGVQPSAITGTVTPGSAPTEWFGGFIEDFSTGATQTYRIDAAVNPTWQIVKVLYIKRPGGGTFKVQVDGVDDASGTIATANATVELGILTIDKGSVATRELKIVNLTGAVRIAGPIFINPSVNGIIHSAANQGGLDIGLAIETPAALGTLTTYLTDFNPDVITFEAKEDIVNWEANAATMMATMRAACPTATIIGIGTTPRTDLAESVTIAENAALRAACIANDCDYFDGYTPVAPGTKLTALGWAGDMVHPAEAANAFLGGLLLDRFGLLTHPASVSQGFDGRTARLAVNANGTDSDLLLVNELRVLDAADSVEDQYSWVLKPKDHVDQQIPNLVRVGQGVWLASSATTEAGVTSNNVGTTYTNWRAKTYVSTISSASVSGAVTVDLSLGAVFLLTLTGNITSFQASNAPTTGSEWEVHFIQDATGSRTIAGFVAAFRLAGGALTLTTTAGKRDILRFRNIGPGGHYEISRSMNLAA